MVQIVEPETDPEKLHATVNYIVDTGAKVYTYTGIHDPDQDDAAFSRPAKTGFKKVSQRQAYLAQLD